MRCLGGPGGAAGLGGGLTEALAVRGGEAGQAGETRGAALAVRTGGDRGELGLAGVIEADAAQQLHRGLVPLAVTVALDTQDAQAHGSGEVGGLVVVGLEPVEDLQGRCQVARA